MDTSDESRMKAFTQLIDFMYRLDIQCIQRAGRPGYFKPGANLSITLHFGKIFFIRIFPGFVISYAKSFGDQESYEGSRKIRRSRKAPVGRPEINRHYLVSLIRYLETIVNPEAYHPNNGPCRFDDGNFLFLRKRHFNIDQKVT
jgi:hypothetical protein